jgi:hypothetical protein
LRRPLPVLDKTAQAPTAFPLHVRIGPRTVSVVDTGDGNASRRFADALAQAGGTLLDPSEDVGADIRIVIRGNPLSQQGRLRAEALEESADVVLGSDRASFARYYCIRLLR